MSPRKNDLPAMNDDSEFEDNEMFDSGSHDPFGDPNASEDGGEISFDITAAARLIPAGNYIGRCSGIKVGKSKAGNAQFVWNFTLMEGEYAGKEFPVYTSLTPAAAWKLNEVLSALGLIEKGQTKGSFLKDKAIGTGATLVIEDSTYGEQPQSQVKTVLPHPRGVGFRY